MTENQKKFVETIYNELKLCAPSYRLKCYPVILAQAIIESSWGTSILAKYNNFFGLKCGKYWKGSRVNIPTKEFINGKLIMVRSDFRAFDSVKDGVIGYCEFLNTKRYVNLKNVWDNKEYISLLCADGYATSRTYKQTILNCIKKYDLNMYSVPSADLDDIAMEVIIGKYGVGEERKRKLEEDGYDYNTVQSRVNYLLRVRK